MPRIRCDYIDCIFLEAGYCIAEIIRIDPDEGCLTYTRIDEVTTGEDESWDDEDLEEIWDDEDEELEDSLEDEWIDDDSI